MKIISTCTPEYYLDLGRSWELFEVAGCQDVKATQVLTTALVVDQNGSTFSANARLKSIGLEK